MNEKIDKYLDEIAIEYKDLLVKAVREKFNSFDDISISDLLKLDSEIKKPLINHSYRYTRIKKLYLYAGIIYMLLGFIIILINLLNKSVHLDSISLLSISLTTAGMLMSLLSFFITIRKRSHKKYYHSRMSEYEVIKTWRDLEGLANDLRVDSNLKTPSSAVQLLINKQLINKEDEKTLREFLKVRNQIVHDYKSYKFNDDKIPSLTDDVKRILEKVHKYT